MRNFFMYPSGLIVDIEDHDLFSPNVGDTVITSGVQYRVARCIYDLDREETRFVLEVLP